MKKSKEKHSGDRYCKHFTAISQPDHKIIDSVTLDNIVSYKKVRDVKIRLS